jgi:hypothetical protein
VKWFALWLLLSVVFVAAWLAMTLTDLPPPP